MNPNTQAMDVDLLTTAEVCEMLKLKPDALLNIGIPRVKLGHRTVRYHRSDIEALLVPTVQRHRE